MNDLESWLEKFGLGDLAPVLLDNDIDLDVLADLDESDLEKLGLSMGRRKRMLRAIATLGTDAAADLSHGPSITSGAPYPGGARDAEGERRQLTVMFCDLVGSTAMSAELDPEELREILRSYRDASNDVINRFEGYVARYSGDGILIYFGYPRANEYDSERAIRAGLHIVEAVARVETHPQITLQVRIGIATGLVVVGDIIGERQSEERVVVGETPNLAARLQALAEPDEVVISPSTRALAAASFQYRSKGRHLLKGFPEPVEVWAVDGSSDVVTRFEAIHGTSASPLVDRETEVEWLRSCWLKATGSVGQVVTITGEAGFGKSRLVHSFDRELSATPCTRLHLQCSPYHDTSAYFPLSTALSRAANLQPGDSNEVKQGKLEQLIRNWGSGAQDALAPLANLLSVPLHDAEDSAGRSPERLKEETFEALLSLFLGYCAQLPLLLVVEDVHWIDPTTWDFLERLSERIRDHRILLILTTRPESYRRLERQDHVTHIELGRLSSDSASAVMSAILGGKTLPAEVREQILAKTDGVPLFVEELTKMVLESNLLRDFGDHYELTRALPELAIPVTLQDSLMARLDRLAPVKEVAQVGAVLGREFDYELLEKIVQVDHRELEAALEKLAEAELLFASGTPPNASYTFKHALVQDAAYSSMLHSKRRALHARVADALERQFPERASLEPELMARHCEQGGLAQRAIEHWSAAGQRALERSAVTEALSHVEKGLALLDQLPDRSAVLELQLETLKGWASIAAHGYTAPQTGQAFSRARELCDTVGDSPHLFPVLHGQWLFHLLQAQVGMASEIALEMLEATKHGDDTSARMTAHRVQGTSAFWLGQFGLARTHLDQALEMHESSPNRPADVTGMFDVRVVGLDFLSLALLPLGYFESAIEHGERAIAEAHASGALVTLAVVLQHGCLFHQIADNRDKVRERAGQLRVLSEREGYPFWLAHARFFEEWASVESPDRDSVTRLGDAREAVIATGSRLFFPYYSALLAELCGKVHEVDRASDLFELALTSILASQEKWFEAEIHRMIGEQHARTGRGGSEAAVASLRTAIRVARDQGAKLWELRSGTSLARILHGEGAGDEARRVLEPICGWYAQGPATPDVARAREVLDTLH